MMRVATFASVFVLCLIGQEALVVKDQYGYEPHSLPRPRNGKDEKAGFQDIRYRVKRAEAGFQAGSPIFYGVGGRVKVEDLQAQYTLFDKQFSELDPNKKITPTIVYVEQRFFGESDGPTNAESYSYFADLTLENVINDHVEVIKQLADEYHTKSILVFGGGHGGLIAGYLANKFATDVQLADYNVLAWVSSPPLKYIRQDGLAATGGFLQEMTTKLKNLLKTTGGCLETELVGFTNLFDRLRALRSNNDAGGTDLAFARALNLDPIPSLDIIATGTHRDLRELIVYIRKQIINLTFNNNPYDATNILLASRKLKALCEAIRPLTDSTAAVVTKDRVNAVLAVFDSRNPVPWKLKNGRTLNKELAASYYQDCTQQQLAYCVAGSTDNTNVLFGSQWDDAPPACTTLGEFDAATRTECQGLFVDTTFNVGADVYKNTYPASLPNRVITTVNTDSIFGDSFVRFTDPEDGTKFSTKWALNSVDNWEFQAARVCDTARVKDVRYLVFRAFGCLSGFINNTTVCDSTKLFNDDKNSAAYDDTQTTPQQCLPDTTDVAKFPFGHDAVTIVNPVVTIQTKGTTKASTPAPIKRTGSTQGPPTTAVTDGAGSIFPMACVLFSSLLVWFSAGAML